MKSFLKLSIPFIALLFGFSLLLSSCDKADQGDATSELKNSSISDNTGDCSCLVNAPATITPEEEEMLVYMREEEKLARDVYLSFFDQYELNTFNKISSSEQRHMDKVLCLLEHYDIDDPASTEIGVFNNPELQELYNDLIAQGSASLEEALAVGATIEDVDIYDLEIYLSLTSNEAIQTIFGRLSCGSRNHMRAFSGLLEEEGITYTPQYISQDTYDDIIAGSHEMCGSGNQGGNGNGQGQGHNGNCNGSGNGGNGNGGNCPN